MSASVPVAFMNVRSPRRPDPIVAWNVLLRSSTDGWARLHRTVRLRPSATDNRCVRAPFGSWEPWYSRHAARAGTIGAARTPEPGGRRPLILRSLRNRARAAVGARLGGRRPHAGALPPVPDQAAPGRDRGRAAGQPGARRPRHEPRDEARPAVPQGADGDRHARWPRRSCATQRTAPLPVEAVEVAPARVPQRPHQADAPGGGRGRHPRRAGCIGARRADRDPVGQRGVRLGQPDRAADRRQCPGRVRGRPAVPGARGRRPATSRASTTSTTPGGQVRCWVRRSRRTERGEAVPEEGYRGDYVASSPARCRTMSGPRPRPPAPTGGIVGHWAAGRIRRGHRGEPRATGRPVRRLEERGVAPRGGLGGARGRAAPRAAATCTSRTAPPGSARPRSATTRTG